MATATTKRKAKTFTMTTAEYHEASEGYEGRCISCGDPAYGVEPDARGYECESCEEHAVYGIEELLFMGLIDIQ
jgi:hypothetical protein